jgi:acetyltransferase-like isoleucine patch superfamily enzyme
LREIQQKSLNIVQKISCKIKDIKNQNIIRGKIDEGTQVGKYTMIDKYSVVGKNTYIGKFCDITKAKIGNYCSIGNFVVIGPGEHKLYKISTSSKFYKESYRELTEKECIIGNDVWIGTQSIILRGVKIGNGAVIGANSVVTKNIPDYAVAIGSPARIIKYRFNKEKIKKILELKWFEKDFDEAKNIIDELEKELNIDIK